jgi:type III restriction enzyme
VDRFAREHVEVPPTATLKDLFLPPYYTWAIEILVAQIKPDTSAGEAPELPRYEVLRPEGSTADVDLWTSKDVKETSKSHVNYVVADTAAWEQQATFHIDRHPAVDAYVKNAGLGFAIPYFYNGQMHDYLPDFIIRLAGEPLRYLILEVKGFDPLAEVKQAAAQRWVDAVNADGRYGQWSYAMARSVEDVSHILPSRFEAAGAG